MYDLFISGDDLIAATHGRSIWILEGLRRLAWERTFTVPPDSVSAPSIAPVGTVTRMSDLGIHLIAYWRVPKTYTSAVGDFVKLGQSVGTTEPGTRLYDNRRWD